MENLCNQGILKAIDSKMSSIRRDPFIDLELLKKLKKNRLNEAEIVNARLEEILMIKDYETETREREITKNIQNGVRSAGELFSSDDFELNDKTLLEISGRTLNEKIPSYRTSEVRLSFSNYLPPSPGDQLEMEVLCFFESLDVYRHPVEKAIYSHFNLFRIQPFKDGNKRVARTVQNGILNSFELPPIIITESESPHYHNLLRKSYNSHAERKSRDIHDLSRDERELYDWLANKEAGGVDDLYQNLMSEKKMKIILNPKKKERGGYFSARNALRKMVRVRDSSGQVRLNENERVIYIKGDVKEGDVAAVLDSLPRSVVGRYSIEPHRKNRKI